MEWTAIPEQTSLGDGAWSWFADPRAVHHRGRTYVGWVAQDGDIKLSVYDHATLTRTTALVAPRVEIDDHANPAVQILPDGRVRAYYSAHGGTRMWYRTSLAPEDVSAWGPAQTVPENVTGSFGFTYPNPIHLAAEGRTYLFWRGGNFNPTFTSQPDGSDAWAPVRGLIAVPGERPYVKYDSDGESTIHIAFTNAHPNESGDVNIYYAAYRGGALRRADGTVIGPLGTAISPGAADLVFDAPQNAWIHDVAHDDQGRPVLVFATFESTSDAARVRASLPVRALDGRALADDADHRRRRLDQRRHARALLQRRHHARPRGPAHGVPLAPDRRGGLGRRDLEHARRRRDLDVGAGHGGLGHEERAAGVTARPAAVRG